MTNTFKWLSLAQLGPHLDQLQSALYPRGISHSELPFPYLIGSCCCCCVQYLYLYLDACYILLTFDLQVELWNFFPFYYEDLLYF